MIVRSLSYGMVIYDTRTGKVIAAVNPPVLYYVAVFAQVVLFLPLWDGCMCNAS